jgi:hypothetical protein
MAYENIQADTNFYRQSFGQKGLRVVTSAFTPVSGEFYRAFTITSDAVVTATPVEGDSLSAVTLLAGTTVYGLFSAISVSSGTVIAYIA